MATIYEPHTNRGTESAIGSTRAASGDDREIPSRLGNLDLTISGLRSTVDALLARLGPVMRSPAPSEAAGDAVKTSDTELGKVLDAMNHRIQQIDGALTDALRRLEV